jgi:serine/threonine protein kinase
MDGSLFISYSHVDTRWMHGFKKHLNGILRDCCRIWTDEDIPAGTTWEERLLGNLQQAAAGLVLVSPDYLVSPWCRRELKSLADARKRNQLAAVYWVLLKPCGWKWSELAELQAVQEPADQALLNLPDEQQREMQLLQCCETIAGSLTPLLKSGDKVLATIRAILARSKRGVGITPLKALNEGDFSIVGRGVDANGNDVVIKVLTNTPLHHMRKLFLQVSEASRKINVPSVVRTMDVFIDGDGYEERIVIVSEFARGERLSDVMSNDLKLPASERHFTLDNVGVLLRRVAEALEALHKMDPIERDSGNGVYRHLMGPLPPANIFYDPVAWRPQISLVGVTNFLWHFFEPATFRSIVGPQSGTYELPEKVPGKQVDCRADQYFLGMLALELLDLERAPLFVVGQNEKPLDPLDLLRTASWARRHEQLSSLVARLLAKDPNDRFDGGLTEVVASLRSLEDSSRALAKYSFRTYVAADESKGVEFSKSFYKKLFERDEDVRKYFEHAHEQRMAAKGPATSTIPDETQHRKLMDGLKAVLNFRPGGNPSSIDSVAARHVDFNLNAKHFEAFEASFLATLEQRFDPADNLAEPAEVIDAWKKLFAPVRAEMLNYPKRPTRLTAEASHASADHAGSMGVGAGA